jgi:hypothetical protein
MKRIFLILLLSGLIVSNHSFSQMIQFINSGEGLFANGWLKSTNGTYLLMLKKDGNFELSKGGKAIWSTNTTGKPVKQATMQPDGNFVLKATDGKVLWSTKTSGHPGSKLKLADNGNILVCEDIYQTAYDGSKVYYKTQNVWSSNTGGK